MILFRLIIILSALAWFETYVECVNKASRLSRGYKLRKEVKEIDEKLKHDVKSTHPDDQFAYVEKLLDKYESDLSCFFKNKKRHRAEAAKLILSIRDLAEPEMCNGRGGGIAHAVAGALLQEPPCRLVRKLYEKYISLQEKVCLDHLPIKLDKRLLKMKDQSKLNRLDQVLQCDLNRGIGYTEAEKQFKKIREHDRGPIKACLDDTFRSLPQEGDADPTDLVFGLQRQLVEKYLLEPCKLVVEQLGADFFELARNWIQFHKVIREPNYEVKQFYRYWSKYEMCLNVLKEVSKQNKCN